MGKQLNWGVADKARKGKKGYWGVNNLARKIKKMYVGVADKARLFWSEGVSKATNATVLSEARYRLAGANNSEYAIFAGGYGAGMATDRVDAYSKSLVRSLPTALRERKSELTGASMENGARALFAGGNLQTSHSSYVDSYDTTLVRTSLTSIRNASRSHAGVSNAQYVMFAGGRYPSGSQVLSNIAAYDNALVRAESDLDFSTYNAGAAKAGNYVVIAGGSGASETWNIANSIDTNLVKTRITSLTVTMSRPASASIGGNALIADGTSYIVNCYNTSLVRSVVASMDSSIAFYLVKGVNTPDYALFVPIVVGAKPSMYDSNLVKTVLDQGIENIIGDCGVAQVGNKVLIAGGYKSGVYLNDVEVFEY